MKNTVLTLILATVFILTGCQNKKSERDSEQAQFEKALAYIDRQDYNSAIDILNSLACRTCDPKVATLLASAYAGRAGIFVENYWGLAVGYDAILRDKKKPKAAPRQIPLPFPRENLPPDARKYLKDLEDQYRSFMDFKDKVETLPYVPYTRRADLHQAVSVLTGIPSQGGRFYRAVLEMILVRSSIQDIQGLIGRMNGPQAFTTCNATYQQTVHWVSYTLNMVIDTLADYAEAVPNDREDTLKMRSQIMQHQPTWKSWQQQTKGARCG